jgi:hypothetical protein
LESAYGGDSDQRLTSKLEKRLPEQTRSATRIVIGFLALGHAVEIAQAAHMAAPTEGQNIKNTLANGEPSTHGAKRTFDFADNIIGG